MAGLTIEGPGVELHDEGHAAAAPPPPAGRDRPQVIWASDVPSAKRRRTLERSGRSDRGGRQGAVERRQGQVEDLAGARRARRTTSR